jgi:hypothetical protein
MRPSRAARCANQADRIALLDLLACLHFDLGEAEVHTDKPAAMVDAHGVAGVELVFGERDLSPSAAARTWVPCKIVSSAPM